MTGLCVLADCRVEGKALAIGLEWNTWGAMEIVLVFAARDFGLIEGRIFVALVVMALATTLIIGLALANGDKACQPEGLGALAPA